MLRKYVRPLYDRAKHVIKDVFIILGIISAFAAVTAIVLLTTGLYILGIIMISFFNFTCAPFIASVIVLLKQRNKKRGT